VEKARVLHITSVDQLRSVGAMWDDLWWRSEVTLPTARAELVAQWVEQFAPNRPFHALVVETAGKWTAALPLVEARLGHVLSAGVIPANNWLPTGGGMLLDKEVSSAATLDILVAAMRELPWSVLWLDEVALYAPRWEALWRAIDRAHMPTSFHERYPVGLIEIDHDWDAYRMRWSHWHRRNMKRGSRQLAGQGELDLQVHWEVDPAEVEMWLAKGFGVEDRSWKGEAGSSVLRRKMFPYFIRQAEQLAKWNQLGLIYLNCAGRTVAFCYGFRAKGVYHTYKIGYDSEYAASSPGQLLFYFMFERLFRDPVYRAVDTVGNMTETVSHWRPRPYTIGSAMIAPRRLLGRMATHVHDRWWPYVRWLRYGSTGRRVLSANRSKPAGEFGASRS